MSNTNLASDRNNRKLMYVLGSELVRLIKVVIATGVARGMR